jgi:ubiquinone/menaquinone biosynthesis C-methylase UbiE
LTPHKLREGVRRAYGAAAERPQGKHPFPVGRRFAESLGYPPEMLDELPSVAVEAFTGVSDVSMLAEIPRGATVLDLGCGAGLDSLVAARKTGPEGKVIGVDFDPSMLARARQGVAEVGLENVELVEADAEHLPLGDGSIDIALANGIFNLNPGRERIFRELSRVVRPQGLVYAAELILRGPLKKEKVQREADWFA